MSYELRVTS